MPREETSTRSSSKSPGSHRRSDVRRQGKNNQELKILIEEILSDPKCAGCRPAYAPPKDRQTAAEKVQRDYGGDWYDLKDVVRATIIAPFDAVTRIVQTKIRALFGLGVGRPGPEHNQGHGSARRRGPLRLFRNELRRPPLQPPTRRDPGECPRDDLWQGEGKRFQRHPRQQAVQRNQEPVHGRRRLRPHPL